MKTTQHGKGAGSAKTVKQLHAQVSSNFSTNQLPTVTRKPSLEVAPTTPATFSSREVVNVDFDLNT